ncbi:MAG: hypothetical protein KDD45_14265, partial [Bdellovibrionales bacterium]|nr:hypothetical protein [Bdellovibrionales bacterium]
MFAFLLWGQVSSEVKSASEEMPLALQIQILDTSVQKFSENCLIDGKINSKLEWCIFEKNRLDQDYQRLEKLVEENQLLEKTHQPCGSKSTNIDKELVSQIDEAVANSLDIKPTKECQKNTEILSVQCAKEITCGSYRALSQVSFIKFAIPKSNSCEIGGEEVSCIRELIHGVVKDIFHNVKAITHDIPKLLKDAAVGSWNWLFGVEDKTSDSLILATSTSDKSLKEWATDKIQFVKNFVTNFVSAINEGIKNSFGCGEWDGPPHFSNCLKPMKSWDCASCLQKINAACGVVGYLGGEIVSMYMVGGALAVTKAIVSA